MQKGLQQIAAQCEKPDPECNAGICPK